MKRSLRLHLWMVAMSCLAVACTSSTPRPTAAAPEPIASVAVPRGSATVDTEATGASEVERSVSGWFVVAKADAGVTYAGVDELVIPVFDEPGSEAPTILVYRNVALGGDARFPLRNPTVHGQPLVLRVIEGGPEDEWVRVQAPVRPRRRAIWVRAENFDFRSNPLRIEVDLAVEGSFILFDGANEIAASPIVSGRESRPTSYADTYVEQVVDGAVHPTGWYGPHILTIASYSEAMPRYGEGLPTQGIRGNPQPERFGTKTNSGDIWIDNELLASIVADHDLVGAPVLVFDSTNGGRDVALRRLTEEPWVTADTVPWMSSDLPLTYPSSYGGSP